MAQHSGSDLVFQPNYWTLDFPLKRCNICLLNKSKPLHTHTQRSGPKDVPVTSYPHGRNKRTSSQSRCLSFQLTSAYAHGVFCVSVLPSDNRSHALEGVLFHICVFFRWMNKKLQVLMNSNEKSNNIVNDICCFIALTSTTNVRWLRFQVLVRIGVLLCSLFT